MCGNTISRLEDENLSEAVRQLMRNTRTVHPLGDVVQPNRAGIREGLSMRFQFRRIL